MVFLKLGIEHILDLNAYDHLLFIMVLCAGFTLKNWKGVIWLATAFTVGHSISLAAVSYDLISINEMLIELLIPITIIISALIDLVQRYYEVELIQLAKYIIVGGFGLIHGSGFSSYLKVLIIGEYSILGPLLGFNLGVEVAQVAIITMVFLGAYCVKVFFKVPFHSYRHLISMLGIIVSIWMIIDRV